MAYRVLNLGFPHTRQMPYFMHTLFGPGFRFFFFNLIFVLGLHLVVFETYSSVLRDFPFSYFIELWCWSLNSGLLNGKPIVQFSCLGNPYVPWICSPKTETEYMQCDFFSWISQIIQSTEKFENSLKEMRFLKGDTTDLLKYARNINSHFANKKCQDVIVMARNLMTSEIHNTVKVSGLQYSLYQETAYF